MRRLALLLEYDGAGFSGSQLQPERRTVQGEVEEAWTRFSGERRRADFASRTDAGVHASGQVAVVATLRGDDTSICRRALNSYLASDLAVRAVANVRQNFDPRRHARSRVYRYLIADGRPRSPLTRNRAWQRDRPLDADLMAEAAATLPQEPRDWAAFGGPVPEGYPTVRELHRCEVCRLDAHSLAVTMEASGYLPRQVRRTVGALAQVGAGNSTVQSFAKLIDGPMGSVGPSAPPQGLTLLKVSYPVEAIDWPRDRAEDGTEGLR